VADGLVVDGLVTDGLVTDGLVVDGYTAEVAGGGTVADDCCRSTISVTGNSEPCQHLQASSASDQNPHTRTIGFSADLPARAE
jgi:hypothetical protein